MAISPARAPMRKQAGTRCILAATLALWCPAPAAADEETYLMYMKGSEGPPATPIRVLWNVRDHAKARISIDLGERYEAALAGLGLSRLLTYDAVLEKARFVVRAPELARFVHTIAVSVVEGLLKVSGAPAPNPDAEVKRAELHITPRPPLLEVVTWLHVTYLAPKRWGRTKVQDLIKGDLIFVGQQEAGAKTPLEPSRR